MRRRGSQAALVATLLAFLPALAPAPAALAAQPACQLDPNPPPAHPRVVRGELDGVEYNVLLPTGYAASDRRYPVLYLLHARNYSANSWLARSDIEEFTEGFTGDDAAIVVMPDGGPEAFHLDYFDRSLLWEQFHLGRLIPHIDATFRTIRNREHRAIAGMSAGGHGAAHYAARRPDLFAAVGSFSGVVHLTVPDEPYAGPGEVPARTDPGDPAAAREASPPSEYAPPRPTCGRRDALGDRVRDAWHWHAHNPTDLATNFRGMGIYLMAGNGQPCGPGDVQDDSLLAAAEPAALEDARYFDRALTAEGIAHVFDPQPCGLHNMATATRGLHAFWPLMVQSFGRRPPRSFDFRSMDPDLEVWDWTFRADGARAPEFLEIRDASADGLTLVGSGTQTVVTGPVFRPRARVAVSGAVPATARADGAGRITLAVDLGAPNRRAQFVDDAGRRFVARRVRFGDETEAAAFSRTRGCSRGSRLRIRMRRLRRGERRRTVRVRVNRRRVLVRRGRRASRTRRVVLRRLPRGRIVVGVAVRTTRGRILRSRRAYPPCR